MIRHPAEGEGDGDGCQQAGDSASTGDDIGSSTTANDAADRPRSGVAPQLSNDERERADDERGRNREQQREYRHAVDATAPLPRPFLHADPARRLMVEIIRHISYL